ncbi:hypothetical protein BXD50_003728 [Salmonella enterica subsp. enterica]|nr:hypothetical protein [Salmonella enterica subsp. enterica]
MATRKIILTREWQQVTDGIQTETIQFPDAIEICNNPVKPGDDAPAMRFSPQIITITPPVKAWVRYRGAFDSIPLIIL